LENKDHLKELVEGCLRNDRRSQEQLFKQFYGKMMVVCLRYISDKDTAQEVLQEGFIKVFDKLGVFDFKGSFEGWIRRIVANTAIDYIRKAKRNPFLSDQDNDFKQEGVDEVVENEKIELLELKGEVALEAISKLSPAYRTVFNLYVMENYSHKEIAELLGINEGTSKSNFAKAKMNLQRILNEKFKHIDL
jgi:RNA polymerase sigma-70 factor (ECF subfamily)